MNDSPSRPNAPRRATGIVLGLLVAIGSAVPSYFLGMRNGTAHPDSSEASPRNPNADSGHEAEAPRFHCPMHPSIVKDAQGTCPICGMNLVLVGAHEEPAGENSGTEGLATVFIDPARQQLVGVVTTKAERKDVGGTILTIGRVAIDETRVRHVNVKSAGFVEKIFVDYVGKSVAVGAPLFSYYSPDLLLAEEDYLLAKRTNQSLSGVSGSEAVLEAAKRRLQLLDVPSGEIRRLDESGKPNKIITFYSPIRGVVTKKDVVEGMSLEAGAMPYELADLSSVWVQADIYEGEIRFVTEGSKATLRLNAYPTETFAGEVAFLDPIVDSRTRTLKVRMSFPNRDGRLRPEMFGEVEIAAPPRNVLAIPNDAILDSGTSRVVYVVTGPGKFEPRRIELGSRGRETTEVTSGLDEGAEVVTRANFLLDSEARLRASLSAPAEASAAPTAARVLPSTNERGPSPHDAHAHPHTEPTRP